MSDERLTVRRPAAILGVLFVTAVVLWIAARAVRRMQIAYGGDA